LTEPLEKWISLDPSEYTRISLLPSEAYSWSSFFWWIWELEGVMTSEDCFFNDGILLVVGVESTNGVSGVWWLVFCRLFSLLEFKIVSFSIFSTVSFSKESLLFFLSSILSLIFEVFFIVLKFPNSFVSYPSFTFVFNSWKSGFLIILLTSFSFL